jgi:peroxiredoxin
VLCDSGNRVSSQFGLVFDLPSDLKELYKTFGIDLERFNGNDLWQLPMPGRFIIDTTGKIIDAEVNPDYTIRPEPGQIIEILDKI